MSAVEIIGFLISLVALAILSFKKKNEENHAMVPSFKEEEEEADDPVQQFLKSWERKTSAKEIRQPTKLPASPVYVKPQPVPFFHPSQPPVNSKTEAERSKNTVEQRNIKHESESRKPLKTPAKLTGEPTGKSVQPIHHEEHKENEQSVALALIKRLPRKANLIIYHDIIGKPKGLQ